MKKYTYISAYDNEGGAEDFRISKVLVVQSNDVYTLSFNLDSDGDGVMDSYHFYDIKSKIRGSNGSPWDFEEFIDADEEYIERSLEDFGLDSTKIAYTLEAMRAEFVEKYLNEASQNNLLYEAAVPFSKKDIFRTEKHDFFNSVNLVFEEGDKNIIPPREL